MHMQLFSLTQKLLLGTPIKTRSRKAGLCTLIGVLFLTVGPSVEIARNTIRYLS